MTRNVARQGVYGVASPLIKSRRKVMSRIIFVVGGNVKTTPEF